MNRTTMSPPRNDTEAVTLGLFFGLMAASEEQSTEACELAARCAQGLTRRQVETCKAKALKMATAAGFGGGMRLLN